MKNQMQTTQLEAYIALTPKLNRMEQEMYSFFKANPKRSYTDIMLANELNWKLSSVNGRRNQLVKYGLIKKVDRVRNPHSKVSNILWGLS